ncbi:MULTISPECIES: alternative ribosome rescue factor ArfA [Pseudomonas]|uniref:Ribosome alternative rescue factor ArfA n=2 Tax=Pseudomonas TaxID=286 RepID=A0ABS0MR90_PSELU|nr:MULTISPECIES: alternative ribosome rescue factor ArfA [Pseudomonas]AYN95695.1 ribosome alternative rescue factor ArfA [Pseudomonas sp. LTJR-52]MBH3439151.1 ribosome alternative rescue factor ArfA [Pseudomonas luteola]MBW5411787.1 ribosome alternative rescue factor ArfA [Pseudomonas sp. MAG002Y]MCG7372667.1 ribosome alternative rescue factor ArfA [Pseudomonas luteola]MDN3234105.1 alternative ribosome rescue factor ArfA [Pseudomonas sp. WAC2]
MTKKQRRPNKAKSTIAQPLFRCRQEKPKKGKGSYRREAFPTDDGKAFLLVAA